MEDLYGLFKRSPELKVYYFIGRLNPPHQGHIAALIQMIERANADNSVALIILGSGPKRERTMDNPIPYETKEAFLRYILPRGLRYEIRQMTTGLADVELWYQSILSHIKPPSCVEFIRFAGDKGDNATKLTYMDTHLGKLPRCKAFTVPIPPVMANAETEMSATTVRKFAYRAHLNEMLGITNEKGANGKGANGKGANGKGANGKGTNSKGANGKGANGKGSHKKGLNGFAAFNAEYHKFYKEFTRNIYNDIIMPILEFTPEKIEEYITPTKPKTKKNGSKPKRSKSKGRKANGGGSNGE